MKDKPRRTLGDKINRGFALVVIVSFIIIVIRFAFAVVNFDKNDVEFPYGSYPYEDFNASEFTIEPESDSSVAWEDDIRNPANAPFVEEVAFNLEIEPEKVTQKQFNERYLTR